MRSESLTGLVVRFTLAAVVVSTAASVAQTVRLVNANGQCLTVLGDGSGSVTPLGLSSCAGSDANREIWTAPIVGSSSQVLGPFGKCLNVSPSTHHGILYHCQNQGELNELWQRTSSTPFTLSVDMLTSTQCLEAIEGGLMEMKTCNGSPAQSWTAADAEPSNVFEPPSCGSASPYSDVSPSSEFCPWIQQLALDHLTSGCGGGKYCPDNPVTRQQLAMILEKAIKGTDTFHVDAGTLDGLDSTQFQHRHSRVAIVALDGTGDYNGPEAAIGDLASWCPAPDWGTRCLVRIQPGWYPLATTLVVPPYVDLEGAGMQTTVLDLAGAAGDGIPAVEAIGDGEIRSLSIIAEGAASNTALRLDTGRRWIRAVLAWAVQAVDAVGIEIANSTDSSWAQLENGIVIAEGSSSSSALLLSPGPYLSQAAVRGYEIVATAPPGGTCKGVSLTSAGNVNGPNLVVLENTVATAGCETGFGLDVGPLATAGARNVQINTTASGVGVRIQAGPFGVSLLNVTAAAGTGVVNEGAFLRIGSSDFEPLGGPSLSAEDGSWTELDRSTAHGPLSANLGAQVLVGASRLGGGVMGAGTFKCVASYTSSYDPLAADCTSSTPIAASATAGAFAGRMARYWGRWSARPLTSEK